MTDRPPSAVRPSLRPGIYSFRSGDLAGQEEQPLPSRRPSSRIAGTGTRNADSGDDTSVEVPGPAPDHDPSSAEATVPEQLPVAPPAAATITAAKPGPAVPPSPPAAPPRPLAASVVMDPRLHELEAIVDRGQWDEVLRVLDTDSDRHQLLPPMGLLCALAAKEAVARPPWAREADQLAIEAVAVLLGVRADSPIARTIAKRILRKPTQWREQPKQSTAWLLITGAILAGVGIGWLVTHFAL